MGSKWITKEEVEKIKKTYAETAKAETERKDGKGSILKTAAALHLSTIKVRRVLITEGLWSSRSSVEIGKLKAAGMSTAQIAEKLHMTEKNVQAYMPYEGGVYGEESQNAVDSRKSRDKTRGKNNIEVVENVEGSKPNMEAENTTETKKPLTTHDMLKYAVDCGKMLFLLDSSCTTVNELSVVREETIELVRAFENELYEEWEKTHKPANHPDPFDYPLRADTEEDRKKLEEYNRLNAAADEIDRWNRKNAPCYNFIYIDCAPEALGFVSPGMVEDNWAYSKKLGMDASKTRKLKKLTYSQFIDRLSTCVGGRYMSGSAYEKTLKTQVEIRRQPTVLVFVNLHLLCERSGGKYSKYTSVGDAIGTVRQIWDSTGVPMLFLSSEEIVKVVDKDDEGRKLRWRVSLARV